MHKILQDFERENDIMNEKQVRKFDGFDTYTYIRLAVISVQVDQIDLRFAFVKSVLFCVGQEDMDGAMDDIFSAEGEADQAEDVVRQAWPMLICLLQFPMDTPGPCHCHTRTRRWHSLHPATLCASAHE